MSFENSGIMTPGLLNAALLIPTYISDIVSHTSSSDRPFEFESDLSLSDDLTLHVRSKPRNSSSGERLWLTSNKDISLFVKSSYLMSKIDLTANVELNVTGRFYQDAFDMNDYSQSWVVSINVVDANRLVCILNMRMGYYNGTTGSVNMQYLKFD